MLSSVPPEIFRDATQHTNSYHTVTVLSQNYSELFYYYCDIIIICTADYADCSRFDRQWPVSGNN